MLGGIHTTKKQIMEFLTSEGTISCKSIESKLSKLFTDNATESKVYITERMLEKNFNFNTL